MAFIGMMKVLLDMDSAAFVTGTRRAEKQMSTFEKSMSRTAGFVKGALVGMLGAFTVDGLVRMVKGGLDHAAALGEQAAQLGVTTKALQEYRYAATQAGISQDEMDAALARLTRTLGDAASGAKGPTDAFAKLGINIRDANGNVRDAGDVIPLIAEALKGIESPAERAAVVVDLFGKSGQKLMPLLNEGAAGVNGLRDAAHRLGMVLSDKQIQDADKAADKLEDVKTVLQARIAGVVADNSDAIIRLANALANLATRAIQALDAWNRWRQAQNRSAEIKSAHRGDEVLASGPLGTVKRVGNRSQTRRPVSGFLGSLGVSRTMGMPKGGRGGGNHDPSKRNAIGGDWLENSFAQSIAAAPAAGRALDIFTASAGRLGEKLEWVAAKQLPALGAATTAATPAAKAMTTELAALMDELFPEDAEARDAWAELNQRLAVLDKGLATGALSMANYEAATAAAYRQLAQLTGAASGADDVDILGVDALPDMADVVSDNLDRFRDSVEKSGEGVEAVNVRIVESFSQMVNGAMSELDRFVKGIKSGSVLDIVSGLLGALDQFGAIFTGGKGFNIGPAVFGNTGGAGAFNGGIGAGAKVAGLGGIDKNMKAMNGVSIARASTGLAANDAWTARNDNRQPVVVHVVAGEMFDARVASGAGKVVANASPTIAKAGSRVAQGDMARRQSRRLA